MGIATITKNQLTKGHIDGKVVGAVTTSVKERISPTPLYHKHVKNWKFQKALLEDGLRKEN